MYDVIVYSGTVLPALGPFKKISLSGYSTLETIKRAIFAMRNLGDFNFRIILLILKLKSPARRLLRPRPPTRKETVCNRPDKSGRGISIFGNLPQAPTYVRLYQHSAL